MIALRRPSLFGETNLLILKKGRALPGTALADSAVHKGTELQQQGIIVLVCSCGEAPTLVRCM